MEVNARDEYVYLRRDRLCDKKNEGEPKVLQELENYFLNTNCFLII